MEVNIQAFGIAKEIIGGSSVTLKMKEHTTVAELKQVLEEKYIALRKLSSFLLAVNDEYGEPGDVLKATDEVAIIPPVSGG